MSYRHPHNTAIFDLVDEAITAPGAGNSLNWNPPTRTRIEVISLTFRLTTDANAANRLIVISGYNGATHFAFSPACITQGASLVWDHRFLTDIESADHTATRSEAFHRLHPFMLRRDELLYATIRGIQAGDTITLAHIRYKQWIQ